jgi:hypothetical protein
MPLLNGSKIQTAKMPAPADHPLLDAETQVFYIDFTGEIFLHYE